MFAFGAQDDDAHTVVEIEGLENEAELVALGHRDDVERGAGEDDVGALTVGVDVYAKAIELVQRIEKVGRECGHLGLRCGDKLSGIRRRLGIGFGLILAGYKQAAQNLAEPETSGWRRRRRRRGGA